jgi:hypothetical protein
VAGGIKTNSDIVYYVLLSALFICAAVNIIPWCKNIPPTDLISLYTAGYMVRHGENPYDDRALKASWDTICTRQRCTFEERDTPPGLPAALLYPPNTLFLYSYCAMIPWRYMTVMGRIICVLLLLLIVWMVWNQQTSRKLSDFLLVVLVIAGFNGIPWLVLSINTSVVVYFFLLMFYWAFRKKNDFLSGMLLGILSLKITIMAPLFVFVCIRKKWKIALISLIAAAIPFLLLWWNSPAFSSELFSSWLRSTREWDHMLYSIYPGSESWQDRQIWKWWNTMLDYMTTLGPIIAFYFRNIAGSGSILAAKSITFITAACMCAVIFFISRKRSVPDEHLIVMLTSIELLVNYHLQYDAIVPLLFFLFIIMRNAVPRLLLIMGIGALSLYYVPFNGLFIRLGAPKQQYLWAFNMALPLLMMFFCACVLCWEGNNITAVNRSDQS